MVAGGISASTLPMSERNYKIAIVVMAILVIAGFIYAALTPTLPPPPRGCTFAVQAGPDHWKCLDTPHEIERRRKLNDH